MADVVDEQLLAGFDDLLRTAPEYDKLGHATPESFSWLGRAAALIGQWSNPKTVLSGSAISDINSSNASRSHDGYMKLMALIYEARHDLLLRTGTARGVVVEAASPYDYFDGVRKVVELAATDLFVVDPYLNADFVSAYLPHVKAGVTVRLLAGQYFAQLVPAASAFSEQHGVAIEVRKGDQMHDRYIFIDGREGYQSGASFKDGGKNAPASFIQVHDAFPQVLAIYEAKWAAAQS